MRVQGILVPGTLVRRDEPCEHRFMMQKSGVKGAEPLSVTYAQCVVPDTFREVEGVEVEVTAEGRLSEDGHLEASEDLREVSLEVRDARRRGGDGQGAESRW